MSTVCGIIFTLLRKYLAAFLYYFLWKINLNSTHKDSSTQKILYQNSSSTCTFSEMVWYFSCNDVFSACKFLFSPWISMLACRIVSSIFGASSIKVITQILLLKCTQAEFEQQTTMHSSSISELRKTTLQKFKVKCLVEILKELICNG